MRAFLLAACLWMLCGIAPAAQTNILFILVDDQGYYDLGSYGATEVKTPRIDALAAEGVRFTDYYAAAPICSPSRAGLLTGRYPRRFGMETWVQRADSKRGIPTDELLISELLKSCGYATACIGKWHVGFQPQHLPQARGFDHYFGLLHNLDDVEAVQLEKEGGVPLLRNGTVVKRPADPSELTRLYTDEAIGFIEQQARVGKPFFVYLPHTMVHEPVGASAEFRGKSGWGIYGDAVEELDFHVGRLIDALKRLGIADNTIVVYASDNGRGPGRNPLQPLRGNKLTTYEAGIRVPCIVWGAGVRRSHVSSTLVHAMDWFPTLATVAGLKVPAGRVLDGRDLTPLLLGKVDTIPEPKAAMSLNAGVPLRRPWNPPQEWAGLVTREEYLNAFFYHGAEGQLAAVRSGRWKLTLNPSLQLYDLVADPGEAAPVRNAQILRKLRGMAVMFQEEMSVR
ncbi:MAG TPA: sulfatase [Roseimicrobium sp.]|nr:sulfatase [Roseimicrobium sp.]